MRCGPIGPDLIAFFCFPVSLMQQQNTDTHARKSFSRQHRFDVSGGFSLSTVRCGVVIGLEEIRL